MYALYHIAVGLLFWAGFPLVLLLVMMTGKYRPGLTERLGLYRRLPRPAPDRTRVWLHAASVGEVQAARAIINALRQRLSPVQFILTTMTTHGKRLAQERLPADVRCLLAPLDVPLVVDRVLAAIDPDIYICLETELWPLLLHKAASRGVKLVLVNGRMSEKSLCNYLRLKPFIAGVLKKFDRIAVISQADRERYLSAGAPGSLLTVEGNVKYDLVLPGDADELKDRYRSVLALREDMEVLITGSTHTGEEELFIPVYARLCAEKELLWILAPRHLERLPAISALLVSHGLPFDTFSQLAGGRGRRHSLVLVDCFGELAGLYAVATYIFCGGSLVAKGGHNVMEAAIWDKPVIYGPSMGDFQDAAELLESVQAGFRAPDVQGVEEVIRRFRNNPAEYEQAGRRAGQMARRQQGAAARQAEIIVQCLSPGKDSLPAAGDQPGNGRQD